MSESSDPFHQFCASFVKSLSETFDLPEAELLKCMPYRSMYKDDVDRHERDMWFLTRLLDEGILTLNEYQKIGNFLFDQLRLDIAEKCGPASVAGCRQSLFDLECFKKAGEIRSCIAHRDLPQIDPIKSKRGKNDR